MREILFRGRTSSILEARGWVYGNLICDIDATKKEDVVNRVHIRERLGNLSKTYKVDKKTIGQYTGVKDRNGVKIFEGDIIRTVSIIASDKVGDNAFNVAVKWSGSGWIANGSLSCMHSSIYEVVGNIYDNKNLIK